MYQDKEVKNEQILFIGEDEYWDLRRKAEVADVLEKLFDEGYTLCCDNYDFAYEDDYLYDFEVVANSQSEMIQYYYDKYDVENY